jgi:hypothetical protein
MLKNLDYLKSLRSKLVGGVRLIVRELWQEWSRIISARSSLQEWSNWCFVKDFDIWVVPSEIEQSA